MSKKLKVFSLIILAVVLVISFFVYRKDINNTELFERKAYNGNVEGVEQIATVSMLEDAELIKEYIVNAYGPEYINNSEKSKELKYSNWTWILEQIRRNKNK